MRDWKHKEVPTSRVTEPFFFEFLHDKNSTIA